MAEYSAKLDDLFNRHVIKLKNLHSPVSRAKALFESLWIERPARYKPNGQFRLNNVIDIHISQESQTPGNCLGLTLLYNLLLHRMGIPAKTLYLEHAFEIGPHVLTLILQGESKIDVENILPNGFDYKGHLDNPSRVKWGDKELVADIYNSQGSALFVMGDYHEALRCYDMAIHLNPQYEKVYLNKLILQEKIETEKKGGSSSRGLDP
ncbi:MAG: tetratricopeptide repeat protein [Thermodesulfobacteriota bacterium]|nr:tetratricopeptide repeat protein [Thermodesulfobacteriota bacterium]